MIKDIIDNSNGYVMDGNSIPSGQVFKGTITTHTDWLFIKVYDSIVSLSNPDKGLWTPPLPTITDYVPVNITIEILPKETEK